MADPIPPAPDPAAAPESGGWFSLLWYRSQILLGLGLLFLLFAIGSTFYFLYEGKQDQQCVVTAADRAFPPPADPQKPRILRVEPVEFQFDKKVCVIIDTAVSPVTLDKLKNELKAAEAAAAQAAPAAAAAVTRAQAQVAAAAPAAPTDADAPPPPAPAQEPAAGPSADATQAASVAASAAESRLQSAHRALQNYRMGAVYKLYINGQPSSLTAHVEGRADPQPLTFTVQPEEDATTANASYWRDILAGPSRAGKVPIAIGLAPQDAAAPIVVAPVTDRANGATAPISFVLYKPVVMWTALLAVLCILLGIAGLAHGTALLREGSDPQSAFSLSRVQMAFWLVLTTAGFLYVWLVTGEYKNVFPAALFVLIGISGATAGAAQFMDGPAAAAPMSKSFLRDISGDWAGGQLQLHRLQIIAWTIILGLIFCWNIVAKLELTSFDTNLLILAGVANGVYVTLKTTENK